MVVVPLVGVGLTHVDALPFGVGMSRRNAGNGEGCRRGLNGEGHGGRVIGSSIIVASPAAPMNMVRVVSSVPIAPIVARLSWCIGTIWGGCGWRDCKERKLLLNVAGRRQVPCVVWRCCPTWFGGVHCWPHVDLRVRG